MNREKSNEVFEWACGEIMAAEKRFGHTLSWRFLTAPKANLSHRPDIAFISLHPGGNTIPSDQGRESSEIGSAYICENWQSPLQKQVQALFREIAVLVGAKNYRSLMNTSLTAYYIPFRSPRYSRLAKSKESRKFAFDLWSRLIQHISPKLIFTLGRITFDDFRKILQNKPGGICISTQSLPTGWGTYHADVDWYAVPSSGTVVLARFPHLSRFKIFDRPASEKQMDQILDLITEHMR